MSPIHAAILALVQGITEFLPISSSAHLVLLPYFLGWEGHSLTFDVVTNLGTLLAAVVYFRHDLVEAFQGFRHHPGGEGGWRRPGLIWAVGLGTVPAALCGLLFYDFFATTARAPEVIAMASILFGLLLWWADRVGRRQRDLGSLGWLDSLLIGGSQAIALIPGTSRSGITMTTALLRGFTREEAARFSFLLAIPIGLLAFAKDAFELMTGELVVGELLPLVVGFVVAGVSAYLVIGWLLRWLARQTMTVFVVYRVILGVLILVVVWAR